MKKIVIFNAEHRMTLSLCRAFGKKGFSVILLSTHRIPRSVFSKYCAKWFQYNPMNLKPLIEFIDKEQPALLIPVLDDSLEIAYQLIHKGVTNIIPLPPYELFITMRNKAKTISFLQEHKIPVPRTFTVNEVMKNSEYLTMKKKGAFIIKPRVASAGRGIIYFEEQEGFFNAFQRYQENIRSHSRFLSDCVCESPLVQEYIYGENYAFNLILYDGIIHMKQFVHHMRYYPSPFGSPIWNETVLCPQEIEKTLCNFFRKIKWNGAVNCELIIQENGSWVVNEINPRLWGHIEHTIQCGIDIVDILTNIHERPQEAMRPRAFNYEYRYFFGTVAYFFRTDNKWLDLCTLMRRHNKHIYDGIDITDPMPHIIHLMKLLPCREVM